MIKVIKVSNDVYLIVFVFGDVCLLSLMILGVKDCIVL